MKKFILIVLLIVSIFTLASCNGDDPNGGKADVATQKQESLF